MRQPDKHCWHVFQNLDCPKIVFQCSEHRMLIQQKSHQFEYLIKSETRFNVVDISNISYNAKKVSVGSQTAFQILRSLKPEGSKTSVLTWMNLHKCPCNVHHVNKCYKQLNNLAQGHNTGISQETQYYLPMPLIVVSRFPQPLILVPNYNPWQLSTVFYCFC